ncbi:SDR family oxidoreductase [Aquimarina megaterium]|uniref:SDR family oxidoreductase n=1 Tax=Aquimarina megaterium TaxID=1443666 RepID=UPI000943C53C|nr:SDR family oxidoreductase [Aquimarina megaterium]
MELGLKNKVAFVAASSQGLGKSVAIELAKEGANLIICGRNPETLALAKKEIQEIGNIQVLSVVGDLSKEKDRASIITSVLQQFDGIDILITNTGGPPIGRFEDLEQKQWDQAYEQLLASTVHLVRGFLPGMKKRPWGRIISITSQAVKQPVENLILSNSVRASVVGLMKTLANELGAYNITVNNVMPGYTETSRLTNLIDNNPSFASAVDTIPLGRFGKPEEFAATVTFLASKRASYITGVSLAIDGGWIKNII